MSFRKLIRYAQVSKTVGGLALRAVGQRYLGREWDHVAYASVLQNALAHLKGPAMKIGQILATVPDILPEAYTDEFLKLHSGAPPMGWGFVKRRMAGELGPQWRSCFSEFEQQAVAAASLGQVHRAISLNGEVLACKLQYPNMEQAITADLEQVKALLRLYERYTGALSTQNLQHEIRDRLVEELNYEQEACHVRMFQEMLASYPGVHIPRVYSDLSTTRLLTLSWAQGTSFMQAQKLPAAVRTEIARNLFCAWYVPLYHYGVLHGDPHLGNYTLHPNPGHINLLDFGCVRIFSPRFIQGSLNLYQALQTQDTALAVQAYEQMGFGVLTHDLIEALGLWARFIYGPLLEDRTCCLGGDFSPQMGKKLAFVVHEKLKNMGGVTPPREFVFMHRAAVGVGAAAIRLNVELNWYRLFHDLIQTFSLDKLQKKQDSLPRVTVASQEYAC